MKRIFDIVISFITIILLFLPMVVIAIAIRLDSPGGVIFRQRRVGMKGKLFNMLKFRTMHTDVDPYGNSPHSGKDVRLTRRGKFFRETSLDELPQFFNVLAGQMSLVGPRPLYERQSEKWDSHQRCRLEVKPAITGYAQVYGRGELTHEDKIELDIEYVEKQSFLLDLKIILKTIVDIFTRKGQGVYEQRYSRSREHEKD